MSNFKKALILGLLTWLLPFIFSIFFYSREGELLINYDVFKSLMVVVSLTIGIVLLIQYFKNVKGNFLRNGGYLGVIWFVMNLLLDILILLPLSGMPMQEYVNQIAIRYLTIPVITIGFGYILEKKLR
ncbi:MAG TPA: hypothetical protein PLS49_01690 [Candidatus Woesebacteria bacterium]|nr:hypothetical protein [Candidatus Woesebacteria bacterium]